MRPLWASVESTLQWLRGSYGIVLSILSLTLSIILVYLYWKQTREMEKKGEILEEQEKREREKVGAKLDISSCLIVPGELTKGTLQAIEESWEETNEEMNTLADLMGVPMPGREKLSSPNPDIADHSQMIKLGIDNHGKGAAKDLTITLMFENQKLEAPVYLSSSPLFNRVIGGGSKWNDVIFPISCRPERLPEDLLDPLDSSSSRQELPPSEVLRCIQRVTGRSVRVSIALSYEDPTGEWGPIVLDSATVDSEDDRPLHQVIGQLSMLPDHLANDIMEHERKNLGEG